MRSARASGLKTLKPRHTSGDEKTDILYITNRLKCNQKGEIISGVGTEGYIIDRKGGEKILKICQNIDCGIDLRYQSHFPFIIE